MHLDLGVEMGSVGVLVVLLVLAVLLHFSDGVWNEMQPRVGGIQQPMLREACIYKSVDTERFLDHL